MTYEVEFFKPQLESILGLDVLTDNWTLSSSISNVQWFGTSQSLKSQSSLGTKLTQASGNSVITWPTFASQGNYSITYYTNGSAASTSLPTFTYTNCAPLNIIAGGNAFANPAAGQTAYLFEIFVTITGPNAQVQFNSSSGVIPGGATTGYLVISQIYGAQN